MESDTIYKQYAVSDSISTALEDASFSTQAFSCLTAWSGLVELLGQNTFSDDFNIDRIAITEVAVRT
jgi:hypothetical protein